MEGETVTSKRKSIILSDLEHSSPDRLYLRYAREQRFELLHDFDSVVAIKERVQSTEDRETAIIQAERWFLTLRKWQAEVLEVRFINCIAFKHCTRAEVAVFNIST